MSVPGRIFPCTDPCHTHLRGWEKSASIQVITENQAWWLEYPSSSFAALCNSFHVKIGENYFSEKGLLLDAEREGLSLHGRVYFGSFRGLKSDIMGPFRWLANMECAHSVISMGHALHGHLDLNGHVLDLNGGTGYIEADRGRSFPDAYLWTQCMWESCSLMLSIATISFGKLRFTGCICAIILNGKEYRVATYRGAKNGRRREAYCVGVNTGWTCGFWNKHHSRFVRLLMAI